MTDVRSPVIIDGLTICDWSAQVFEQMHQSGLTAVNCTCVPPWANIAETLRAMARFHGWFAKYSDILRPVYSVADIHAAKEEGRVGIILGWQNSTGFDDFLPYIRLFKRLGLGVVQLTYNTMNSVGSGCFETRDSGLSDFGHEVVAEMNAVGIAIDLSHVGERTASEVIRASGKPVTYSHIAPRALKDHARNKTDAQIRELVDAGGLVGITHHPPFQANGNSATLDDFVGSLEHCLNVAGEDSIAIGTDFVTGHVPGGEMWEYLLRDKGHARKLLEIGTFKYPDDFSSVGDYRNLYQKMQDHGWRATRIEKVLGDNWLRFRGEVWGG